jgi:hypothetical protein
VSEHEHCRVCGYRPAGEAPYLPEGGGLYGICPCCGVEWGYQDATPDGARHFREAWLARGAPWDDPALRPADWDLQEQLRQVPAAYR